MAQTATTSSRRFAVIASVIMAIVTLSIGCIFYWLYDASKENILAQWRNETQQSTQKISQYLKMPIDAVAFSAVTLNTMLREGRSCEEAGRYLVAETAIYASVINDNTTGVYAYYKGRYLDGSGWTPPADYKPTERPWYTDAVKNRGEVTLVKPYLNLQTDTMMMSVSKLLADGSSVVSMDIFLDGVQRMAETVAANPAVRAAIVVDKDGFMLAHSDKSRIGMRLDEGNDIDKAVRDAIATSGSRRFELYPDDTRIVIGEPFLAGWHALLVLDKPRLYNSLRTVYLASGAFLLFIMGTGLVAFLYVYRKSEHARKLEDEIHAAASIYMAMFRINLDEDAIVCVRDDPEIQQRMGGHSVSYSKLAEGMADRIAAEQSRSLLASFLDPSTLEQRLAGLNSITQEFMDMEERWVRLRFTVIRRDADGRLHRVLMAFESIDEDKRRQENLRKLSETDSMTGIRNRGSGERLVRQCMAEGRKGFFCLMDADKFKQINDTFGHSTGDKVIIAIADCLKRAFRDSDIVFRLGGDEFCAYAEGVDSEPIAQKILQRLFDNINNLRIPKLGTRRISLSVGATFYPATHRDSFEAMYQRADEGTYSSKKTEGNKSTFVLQKVDPS